MKIKENTIFQELYAKDLLSIREASVWASEYLQKNVSESNISYLIQYGKVKKIDKNGATTISRNDLQKYYESFHARREADWKNKLGGDLNWHLSFEQYKEAETTKHVHRLHPYKGKFIPQLVEYFLDSHTDEFKKEIYFRKGDIVLDPFAGSGTTLVQANELAMHAVGIDISAFNSLITNAKLTQYDLKNVHEEISKITFALKQFLENSKTVAFEKNLLEKIAVYNTKYFPSPEFKRKVHLKEIDEEKYGEAKAKEFLPFFKKLVEEFKIELLKNNANGFLDKWYLQHVRNEIEFVFELVKKIQNPETKKIVSIILSRTIRSCRATTHADLATLKEPITTTYYCSKHGKICKPLFSILSWLERYSKDTIQRLVKFNSLRSSTFQYCLTGDSRTFDIFKALEKKNIELFKLVKFKKINGIFSSPPYVGLIDYHEQHAYAYDLFSFERKDEMEIGAMKKGSGREARNLYAKGIADVLGNCKNFLIDDYNIFLVANDKYNLYPTIAENAGMKIVNKFKRPVLNRTEKDKGAYSEIIFHLKEK
jgi:hypothetical protein